MAFAGISLKIALLTISTTILRDDFNNQRLANKVPVFGNTRPYDYIIIGGGTAGCVIAGRLSENPNLRILVLEAGGVEDVSNEIPAMDVLNVLEQTDQFNQYLIQPQKVSSQGFPNHQFNILSPKVLGGGSTVNGMFYNRGGPDDYNGWVKDYGVTGWSYEEVLPYFKKSENQSDPILRRDWRYHGTGGPLTITTPDINATTAPAHLLSNIFIEAAREHGYFPTDINGPHQVGTTRIQRNTRNGKRLSTARAYLQPAINRPNLFILTGATVTKIYFDEFRQADIVQYNYKGQVRHARVSKQNGEVIISAGAINSPKILLLSGIGPITDLEALGIPVIADLPVGQNLQDHVRVAGVDFVVNSTIFTFWEDLLTVQNLELLYVNATGPLASQFYLHQGGIINYKTKVPRHGQTFGPSDLMIAPAMLPPGQVALTVSAPTLNQDILNGYYGPYVNQSTLNLFTCLNYIRSRGFVKLRSRDPLDPPIIDPAYLTHPDDLARLVEAYKFSMNLGQTEAFRKIGAKPFEYALPGCEEYFDSTRPQSDQDDDYIICKLQQLSACELHECGTCKMGAEGDPSAVVDSRLKLLGQVKGVRVADASIMPTAVTGNLMAPVIMIAEKLVDMILEDRNFQ